MPGPVRFDMFTRLSNRFIRRTRKDCGGDDEAAAPNDLDESLIAEMRRMLEQKRAESTMP